MPIEYELRFKLERDLAQALLDKGFRQKELIRMADLIFEPKDWKPGDMIAPGYSVARVRLLPLGKQRLEFKEFLEGFRWNETGFDIRGSVHFVSLLSKLMVPRRVIQKFREVWSNGTVEVCIDDVRHLGRFVEIEGPELYVNELALELGFRLEDHQANYGSQLFYLEKMGFAVFQPGDMDRVLKEFGH